MRGEEATAKSSRPLPWSIHDTSDGDRVQEQIIQWLAILPLVLAAFRAITIGDRLYAPVVTGRDGGADRATQNYALAGLSFVGMALVVIAGANAPALLETAFALILIAFGGFVIAGYMYS